MTAFVVKLNLKEDTRDVYRACRIGSAVTTDIHSAFPFKTRDEARFFSIGSAESFDVVKLSKTDEKKLLKERAQLLKED